MTKVILLSNRDRTLHSTDAPSMSMGAKLFRRVLRDREMHMFNQTRVTLGLTATLLLANACIATRPRVADTPKPRAQNWIADFSAISGTSGSVSNSVFLQKGTGMKRVLLSPNLVFETSRSSLDEPRTYGPTADPRDGSPDLPNALGRPVPIALSTVLLRHMAMRNKQAIAPAITKRWFGCTEATACPTSWVERVLFQAQRARLEQMSSEERENFPDSILAIRTFGLYSTEIDLVAIRNEGTKTIELRKRRFTDEKSDCDLPPMRTFGVALEAELLNIANGTLIARIDERNLPKVPDLQKREVAAMAYEPQWSIGYEKDSGGSPRLDSSYKYVSSYVGKDVLCESVRAVYEQSAQTEVTTAELMRVAGELLATAFQPLWGN